MKQSISVLVITSHVVRGRVGLRAAAFALERLGYPTLAMPTITLPWHPGHGVATRIVPPTGDFAALMGDLAAAPWLSEVGAVLTGYLGSAEQAAPIAAVIKEIKSKNPSMLYCCDPVIGDAGGLYVPDKTAFAMRDMLLPLADIITPNRFEFDWLTDATHETNEAMVARARQMPQQFTAITSAHAMMKNSQGTLLYDHSENTSLLAEHRAFPAVPNGPGDLFAALFLAWLLSSGDAEKSLRKATAGVFDVLAQTVKAGSDELLLVEEQSRIEHPMAMVTVRRLASEVAKRKGAAMRPTPLT